MKPVITVWVGLLLLVSCKPTPADRYRQVVEVGKQRAYTSWQEAAENENAAYELQPGEVVKLKLTVEDPVIHIENGTADYFSNFQTITLDAGIRRLFVRSLCDCLGTRKLMLLPRLLWRDAQGSIYPLTASRREIREPDLRFPIHLWEEYPLPEGMLSEATLFLHADNSQLDSIIARSTNTTYVYIDPGYVDVEVPYKVKISPTGKLQLTSE